jgi:hypothetical protein
MIRVTKPSGRVVVFDVDHDGIFSASPTKISVGKLWDRFRASATITSLLSSPTTLPVFPTKRAISITSPPTPQPISRTRWPADVQRLEDQALARPNRFERADLVQELDEVLRISGSGDLAKAVHRFFHRHASRKSLSRINVPSNRRALRAHKKRAGAARVRVDSAVSLLSEWTHAG